MSAGVDALLNAARYLELQEQERLSSSSSSSSLSTSPHSRYSTNKNNNQNFLSSTPPVSPTIDGQRNGDLVNGGAKIICSGKQQKKVRVKFVNISSLLEMKKILQ